MKIDFKSIISNVVPFLGSLIGGPFGGTALKIISKSLCGNEESSQSELLKALQNITPDKLQHLKVAEQEYKVKMAQIGLDEAKVYSLDRENARKREIELRDRMPSILSIILSTGFFSILIILIFCNISEHSRDVIDIMLGSLGTAWISTISYYFGSSKSSKDKTFLLGDK
ncbi:hypothetical protein [Flavobacterium sp.]|uniref:hypothetical protein n=1 Tax=Flavobacterium sp. TaxID=239 RepID=UPI003F6A0643